MHPARIHALKDAGLEEIKDAIDWVSKNQIILNSKF
jgi:hypothetical protein